ncbi:hypothetical protein [Dysgonomonas sp. 521]|uniref:hypothetical protein n=1 Tax=Dysgonomonas sp. 521 TaxID=2302932 RepID=UPI0013D21840|nr:hypothetical protein [Dysgonomonas sp. 521]
MKNKGCLIAIGIILILLATSVIIGVATDWGTKGKPKLPEYEVLESKRYDVPAKSQVSLRVALVDTATVDEQIKDLLHSLVGTMSNIDMKYHDKPTNVYVYIYKSKDIYNTDSSHWMMMYQKSYHDKEGTYTYEPLLPFR